MFSILICEQYGRVVNTLSYFLELCREMYVFSISIKAKEEIS